MLEIFVWHYWVPCSGRFCTRELNLTYAGEPPTVRTLRHQSRNIIASRIRIDDNLLFPLALPRLQISAAG